MTEKAADKGPEEKAPKKITLKKLPDGAGRKREKGTETPSALPPTDLELALNHPGAVPTVPTPSGPVPILKPETPIFDTQPEPTFLDTMKELLAEVEQEREVEEKKLKEVKERFRVKDVPTATWAAGKIALWQSEIERRKYQAKNYVGEAERALDSLKFLFMTQLEEWAKANIPQDKKHIKLASATLKFTDTKEKLEIKDEKAVVAWATINLSDAVEITASLQILKDQWLKDRIVPAGCEIIPAGTNFKVE